MNYKTTAHQMLQYFTSSASLGVPFDGLKPNEAAFLSAVSDGEVLLIDRARLEKLLRIASTYDGEAAYLGGGGTRAGDEDWLVLADFQEKLGIPNDESVPYHYGDLRYRDPVREALKNEVTQIIAVGSGDGILTSAALLNIIGQRDVGITFTQAFEIDQVDISSWEPGQKVAFVDLAVNNSNPQMTEIWVQNLRNAGHEVVAVIDEHDHKAWLKALGSFDELIVAPQSQSDGKVGSSGEVLRKALYSSGYWHLSHLLEAAADADRMEFRGYSEVVNKSVKTAIKDNSRRVYLARHFAFNTQPDDQILSWMSQYDETFGAEHANIIAHMQEVDSGVVRVITTGRNIDMTVFMKSLYDAGARVVIVEGEQWAGPARGKVLMVSYGTSDKGLDLMKAITVAGVTPAGGFANKVNVEIEDEALATEAVRKLLAS